MARYLEHVGGVFRFRRRIPQDLVGRFGSPELRVRLQAKCYAEARALANEAAAITERMFRDVKRDPSLTPEQIRELARRMFQGFMEDQENHLQGRGSASLEHFEDRDKLKRTVARQVEGYQAILEIDGWRDAAESLDDFLAKQGVRVERGDPAFKALCTALLRAALESHTMFLARLNGDYTVKPKDPLFQADGCRAWCGFPTPEASRN